MALDFSQAPTAQGPGASLKVVPLELRELNELVRRWHRHHKRVQGHRFSIGAVTESGELIGGASAGRPVARKTSPKKVLEVTRLVTDGTLNGCSILYAALARAGKALGYEKIQTFILDNESGASLKAAGWEFEGYSDGKDGWQNRDGRRNDQPNCRKQRWSKKLNAA